MKSHWKIQHQCESFLYFIFFLNSEKRRPLGYGGRGGRIHTLTSTPFARLIVKSEGGRGWGGGGGLTSHEYHRRCSSINY